MGTWIQVGPLPLLSHKNSELQPPTQRSNLAVPWIMLGALLDFHPTRWDRGRLCTCSCTREGDFALDACSLLLYKPPFLCGTCVWLYWLIGDSPQINLALWEDTNVSEWLSLGCCLACYTLPHIQACCRQCSSITELFSAEPHQAWESISENDTKIVLSGH